MKQFIFLIGFYSIASLLSCCANSEPETPKNTNNDTSLVGKWVRNGRYHLDLYSNGIGSKDKNVTVTEDIKQFKKERINWVTYNDNFLLINSDEKVMGFSYQVIGDTLYIRQPEDNLEFFLKVKSDNND
ncbi:MAG: hypothetical protein MK105_10860 [Crocinitomicaceae bacterium]|nr:hypothetical protein [Crocinitomicaceae bacterium]